ncbi:MAG: hypothetical protein IPK82_30665 [Polyangiaceae bacterium]|nr:hypothetical protein [Polyangiaceae bacterium]
MVVRWLRSAAGQDTSDAIAQWSDGGRVGLTRTESGLTLAYTTDGIQVIERLKLEFTPCNYGGARPWALCPVCNTRRAVLYAATATYGRFLCRACIAWPYGCTWEHRGDRALRRVRELKHRQGCRNTDPFVPLVRKRYQRWATFAGLLVQQHEALQTFLNNANARIERLRSGL